MERVLTSPKESDLVESIKRVGYFDIDNDQQIAAEREDFIAKLKVGLTINASDVKIFYNAAKPCAGEEEMDELICQVCQALVAEPLKCKNAQCDTLICRLCAEDWYSKPTNKCHNCRQANEVQELGRSLKKMVDRVQVTCRCTQVMKYVDMEEHMDSCFIKQMTCPLEGCDVVLKGTNPDAAASHYAFCPKALVSCQDCHIIMKREEKPDHPKTCPHTIINCRSCKQKVMRSSIQEHDKNDCPDTKMKCEKCGANHLRRETKQHQNKCKEFPVTCDKCNAVFKRKEERKHDCVEHLQNLMKGLSVMYDARLKEKENFLKAKEEQIQMMRQGGVGDSPQQLMTMDSSPIDPPSATSSGDKTDLMKQIQDHEERKKQDDDKIEMQQAKIAELETQLQNQTARFEWQQQQLNEQTARLRWHEARQRNADAQSQAQQSQLARMQMQQRAGGQQPTHRMGAGFGAGPAGGGAMRQTFNPGSPQQNNFEYAEPVKPGRSAASGTSALILAASMLLYYCVFGASLFGYQPFSSAGNDPTGATM